LTFQEHDAMTFEELGVYHRVMTGPDDG